MPDVARAGILSSSPTASRAGAAKGREVTASGSIRTDAIDTGGRRHDREVVTGPGAIASRNLGGRDAFRAKIIDAAQAGAAAARERAA